MAMQSVGRYLVQESLGRGAMGEVFRATDEAGRVVALKVLHSDTADAESIERFKREGEALALLNHPNIVRCLDFFWESGRHYLVMELVEGGSLRRLLDEGPLQEERAVAIGLDLADALTRSHRLSIVHRDLKPENILLGPKGEALLTDFGVAHIRGAPQLTSEDATFGTLAYMCPESFSGQPVEQSHDIWSLGVILFEMLAGRLPFTAEHPAGVLNAILSNPLPDLARLRPGLSESLIDLVSRMLDRDPATRIPSVRQVGLELEGFRPRARVSSFQETSSHSAPVVAGLPRPSHPFLGRQAELEHLKVLLGQSVCLTLLGQGGIGKSRLALELASRQASAYAHGAAFVALANLDSPQRILPAIAEAVGLNFAGEREPFEQLVDYLQGKSLLLVLDNYEHVVAGGELVGRLCAALPSLRCLVTSRTRLNLTTESVHQVAELTFPAVGESLTGDFEAIEFFLAMARRTAPGFRLEDEDLEPVARICRFVGGIPLGLELAAAWVRVLSPAEIADEMQRDLSVLESRSSDTSERHRSLRAAFEYSWRLLDAELQIVLSRLSVFRGGFSREAAAQVAGANVGALLRLVDSSLVRRNVSGRFVMNELVRQFAAEKLADETSVAQLHADYFADFLCQRQQLLRKGGKGWVELFGEVEVDLENARIAWFRSIELGRTANLGRSCETLWTYLDFRGRSMELSQLVEPALQCSASDPLTLGKLLTVRSMYASGTSLETFSKALDLLAAYPEEQALAQTYLAFTLHFAYGRSQEALDLLDQSLVVHRKFGNTQGMGFSLVLQALAIYALRADAEEALELLEEALLLYRRLNSPHALARFLSHQASLELTIGRFEEARVHALEALEMAGHVGDRLCTCKLLLVLGEAEDELGRPHESWASHKKVLTLAREMRLVPIQIRVLARMARFLGRTGEAREAATILHFLEAHEETVETARARILSDLEKMQVPEATRERARRRSQGLELSDVVTSMLERDLNLA